MKTHFMRNSLLLLSALLACTGPSLAQTADTVTFRLDGGEGITGEMIEYDDNVARLETSVGLIAVPLEGASCIGLACPESIRIVPTLPPLVLTALDGTISLSGNLLQITDDQYVIATDFGEFRVDIDRVSCEGEGCPEDASQPQLGGEVVLTNGAATIEGRLVGLEDKAFIVDVAAMGIIKVSTDLFTCTGDSCP
ncbi:hypothetical protein [Loktanella sp. Alg231-35]|uniref:hypothetical protein n=1 Tax=Loktanella sp. Alg231-35 TaxID=1922220 RepID=UPI00131F254D|nr:hypothetical protein [Loktanella sp. Alg231-35]